MAFYQTHPAPTVLVIRKVRRYCAGFIHFMTALDGWHHRLSSAFGANKQCSLVSCGASNITLAVATSCQTIRPQCLHIRRFIRHDQPRICIVATQRRLQLIPGLDVFRPDDYEFIIENITQVARLRPILHGPVITGCDNHVKNLS